MPRQYGYTIKLTAWKGCDPAKDDDTLGAVETKKKLVNALADAGFEVDIEDGRFGHTERQ